MPNDYDTPFYDGGSFAILFLIRYVGCLERGFDDKGPCLRF